MAKILFFDGFSQYADGTEVSGRWTAGNAYALSINALGRSKTPALIGTSSYARDGVAHVLDAPVQRIGVHFRVRMAGFGPSIPVVVAGGRRMRADISNGASSDAAITSLGAASDTLSLTLPNSRYAQLHNIVRSAATKNALLVGQSSIQMSANQLYSVEILADVSAPLARMVMAIDGVIVVDETYDRDRIAPADGYTNDEFSHVTFLWPTSTPAYRPSFSDVVIYEPDAGDLAPIGPLAVDYMPSSGTGLPVSDRSGFVVDSGSTVEHALATAESGLREIFAARAISRTISGAADQPYSGRVTLSDSDGDIARLETGRIDSMSPKFIEAPLTDVRHISDLSSLKITAGAI